MGRKSRAKQDGIRIKAEDGWKLLALEGKIAKAMQAAQAAAEIHKRAVLAAMQEKDVYFMALATKYSFDPHRDYQLDDKRPIVLTPKMAGGVTKTDTGHREP